MLMRDAAVIFLLCAAPLRAAPANDSQIAIVAESRLRAWLANDPKVQEKITRAKNATQTLAERNLKDVVVNGPQKARSRRPSDCLDFKSCPVPPLVMNLPGGADVEKAIRAMVRPWIWLADTKGVRLGVAPAGSDAQTILLMNIQKLGLSSVALNITPRKEGGVHLWFSRGSKLAALYSREHAALQAARP
jgi:hypothetical protein